MDNYAIAQTIRTVVSRVLEDASFVFTDELPVAARDSVPVAGIVGVSLTFKGECAGSFRLWGTPGFAALLVANMTGEDGDTASDAKKDDAMKEILNIIVGNVLTELHGTTAVFELGIPETADPLRFAEDRARDDAIWLMAEEHPLLCVADRQP